MSKPLVAILGRPNVGKSTVFNRLVNRQSAIVSDVAGTTRDRVSMETEWAERPFILVDTGGLDVFPETEIWRKVKGQIELAIDEADVILFVVDASEGITTGDRDVAEVLRPLNKPFVLAANKADNEVRTAQALEFYELGVGEPVPVSAYHNLGMDELMSRVTDLFPPAEEVGGPEADFGLALVGRTNVGKSMLTNEILGDDRSIVSEVPGTTRDALDSFLTLQDGGVLRLIDTAGIRRRGRIEPGIERYSVLRTLRAIDRADVAVLLLDASEVATAQDSHVASYVLDAYKGLVLAVNKWDLADQLELDREKAERAIRLRFKFAPHVPIVYVSALEGTGIEELLQVARGVYDEWAKTVPRYGLRRVILDAVAEHPPATGGRRQLKVFGVAQDSSAPPSFTFYVNLSEMVHFSYRRYLENALRKAYGFEGSRLRMRFKGRRDP
jgi:GTP-binding protein